MANLITTAANKREDELKKVQKTHQTLSGGLQLPEGEFPFTVAKEKAFGILEVNDKWALPIVAGTMTVEGKKIEFVRSAEPLAKTLVVTDSMFLAMEAGKTYKITVALRKGNKRVVGCEPAEEGADTPAEESGNDD